ncbi:MAG: ABC transporter permease subunit [Nannocystales bacterium]
MSGIVALVSLIIASAVVGRQLAEAGRALEKASTGEQADAFRMMTQMVASMADFPLDMVRSTLEMHSPPLVGAFAFLMLVMPLLALTMGYDQCAGDIETRHARYLAFRIDRTTLYLGKLLGAWALISLTVAVAAVSMAGYIQVRAGSIPGVAEFLYIGRTIVTVSVAAFPLLALLGLLGTLRGRARRVVLLALLLWLAIGLASAAARHWMEVEFLAQSIEVLWPTNGRWNLILDDWASWAKSAAQVLVYSAVAVALGLAHFRRRDL